MKLGLRLLLVEPDAENRAVTPTRLANSNYRSREHLTPDYDTRAIQDYLRLMLISLDRYQALISRSNSRICSLIPRN